MTNRYLHGNSIDAIVADEANGSVGWTLTDNLGTVRDVVDGTGARQNHIVYGSFGNVTSETNPSFDTRFTFTGREFDAETGNYDYRFRPFRPTSGRFIEEDPMVFNGGDTNLYRYVENSPNNFIDSNGYFKEEPFPNRTETPVRVRGEAPTRGIGGIVTPWFPRNFPVMGYPPSEGRPPSSRFVDQFGATPTGGEANDQIEEYYRRKRTRENRSKVYLIDELLSDYKFYDPSYYPPDPNECPDRERKQCKRRFNNVRLGGSYTSVRAGNYGGHAHHAPSWQAIMDSGIWLGQEPTLTIYYKPNKYANDQPIRKRFGYFVAPTICMLVKDHEQTISYGGRSSQYVNQVVPLIQKGDFLSAQQVDIQDIKSIAKRSGDPSRYDIGVTQMINYTERLMSTEPWLFRIR